MKTKALLLFFAMCLGMTASAQGVAMGYYDPEDETIQHRMPVLLPQVSYEDSVLSIAAPYELSDVTVVIRDEDGEILYSYSTLFIIGTMEITLPCAEDEMFSVELIYTGHHLIGYF